MFYTLTDKSMSVFYDGVPYVVDATNQNFEKIRQAVFDSDGETFKNLIDLTNFVAKASNGRIKIGDDIVMMDNVEVPEYLARRIIMHHREGFPIEPLCRFAERLMSNPTADVREDLYKWMENGHMPLTPDGCFVAYKLVRSDFTPIHRGPYGTDQSVGKVVEMPREECDDNRNNTCSRGLHFCSYEYLPNFGLMSDDNVVIVLKIAPEDVVAIPTDYNLSKGRTCRFEVISTIAKEDLKKTFGDQLIYGGSTVEEWDEAEELEEEMFDDMVEDDEEEVVVTSTDGRGFTLEELREASKAGMSAGSRMLDISRSTFTRWVKKYL